MGELVLEVYGPVIDRVGGWCLGLIAAVYLGKATLIWIQAFYSR